MIYSFIHSFIQSFIHSFIHSFIYSFFLRSTKENAFLILCWVSCVMQPEKIEIFSVMGPRRPQFSSPPPEDFCRGLRSAGNWYRLLPRFHDAQVPNGQCGDECRRNIRILVETDILFTFFEFLRKLFEFADKCKA